MAAELVLRRTARAARRTDGVQGGGALAAELHPSGIFSLALGTPHAHTSNRASASAWGVRRGSRRWSCRRHPCRQRWEPASAIHGCRTPARLSGIDSGPGKRHQCHILPGKIAASASTIAPSRATHGLGGLEFTRSAWCHRLPRRNCGSCSILPDSSNDIPQVVDSRARACVEATRRSALQPPATRAASARDLHAGLGMLDVAAVPDPCDGPRIRPRSWRRLPAVFVRAVNGPGRKGGDAPPELSHLGGRLRCRVPLAATQALVQRLPRDSQDAGGNALVAVGLPQRLADQGLLRFSQGGEPIGK